MIIPKEVLILNPKFTAKEIKEIFNTLLKSKSVRLKSAQVFSFSIQGIGKFSSRKRKVEGYQKIKSRDRKRKKKQIRNNYLSKKQILW
jgi:hypothetical protein